MVEKNRFTANLQRFFKGNNMDGVKLLRSLLSKRHPTVISRVQIQDFFGINIFFSVVNPTPLQITKHDTQDNFKTVSIYLKRLDIQTCSF